MKQTPNPSGRSTFKPVTHPFSVIHFQEHLQYKYYANSWSIYSPGSPVLDNRDRDSLFLLRENVNNEVFASVTPKNNQSTALGLLYAQNKIPTHPVTGRSKF